jgi:hypothetical protein
VIVDMSVGVDDLHECFPPPGISARRWSDLNIGGVSRMRTINITQ